MQRATDQSDPPVLLDGIGTPAVGARSQQNARTTPIAGSNGTFRARPAQHASDREAVAIAMRDAEARLQSFQNVVYHSISPIQCLSSLIGPTTVSSNHYSYLTHSSYIDPISSLPLLIPVSLSFSLFFILFSNYVALAFHSHRLFGPINSV